VGVLYVAVPPGVKGGELHLFQAEPTRPEQREDAKVPPREGRLIVFRGDAFHGVPPFSARGGNGTRVSLVLESYIVPALYYRWTSTIEGLAEEGATAASASASPTLWRKVAMTYKRWHSLYTHLLFSAFVARVALKLGSRVVPRRFTERSERAGSVDS